MGGHGFREFECSDSAAQGVSNDQCGPKISKFSKLICEINFFIVVVVVVVVVAAVVVLIKIFK